MTGALASFLDAIHLQRTALVGNSWSGGWALSFAQRYPHRVSRLALLDSSGLDVPDIWAWRVFKIPVLGELLANFDVTKGSVRSFLNLAMYHRGLVTAEMVNEFWAPATYRVNRLATVLLERRLGWGQTQARLGSTSTPALILWGRQDRVLASWQAAAGHFRTPRCTSCPAAVISWNSTAPARPTATWPASWRRADRIPRRSGPRRRRGPGHRGPARRRDVRAPPRGWVPGRCRRAG